MQTQMQTQQIQQQGYVETTDANAGAQPAAKSQSQLNANTQRVQQGQPPGNGMLGQQA